MIKDRAPEARLCIELGDQGTRIGAKRSCDFDQRCVYTYETVFFETVYSRKAARRRGERGREIRRRGVPIRGTGIWTGDPNLRFFRGVIWIISYFGSCEESGYLPQAGDSIRALGNGWGSGLRVSRLNADIPCDRQYFFAPAPPPPSGLGTWDLGPGASRAIVHLGVLIPCCSRRLGSCGVRRRRETVDCGAEDLATSGGCGAEFPAPRYSR